MHTNQSSSLMFIVVDYSVLNYVPLSEITAVNQNKNQLTRDANSWFVMSLTGRTRWTQVT